ncbi:GNAT family N-acetyltransferase [Zhouia amylolytica]|uniref:Acetyltransferase-like protein n=1 Tax=Zhouia amylolytica AD3 TaxID=1286632 RepID=W2UQC4_9FLAO|nr:GNAT family N-acetyltransferase [Zhouia amylolytica]ETN95517.1 acetyltransferase-like protein [Zhouia amylolytica AD3]MCQ0110710.1 N-acetyltransferase [Zhouia amylolytica]
MELKLINNEPQKRFEVHYENSIAFVDYKLFKGGIAYIHTEVPKALSGKGIGSFLAKGVLDYADENGLKVKPYCPFIKAYIDRHVEYQKNSIFHQKDEGV